VRAVVILSEAASDLEEGQEFYELQEPGLGEYFIDSLLADITSLGLFHGVHPVWHGFHRMLSARFPFGIYYRDHETETWVFAVFDLRRDPNWIRQELGAR
jgi:hypothetical protein